MRLHPMAKTFLMVSGLSLAAIQFTGCQAAHTAIAKRNLDVQTKMTETVFLEPTSSENKTIFVDVKNTSDQDIAVRSGVEAALKSRGYTIVDNPNKASYMLQANVLQIGKSNLNEIRSAFNAGFGNGAVQGAVAGAATGYVVGGGSGKNAAAIGLAGAAAGFIADAMVEDVYYSMVTDLQVRERASEGETVVQTQSSDIKQGSSTNVSQVVQGTKTNWKTYRTRVVSSANKVNLQFEEAQPVLQTALGKSIAGIF